MKEPGNEAIAACIVQAGGCNQSLSTKGVTNCQILDWNLKILFLHSEISNFKNYAAMILLAIAEHSCLLTKQLIACMYIGTFSQMMYNLNTKV